MAHAAWREKGRPRATGRPRGIASIGLSQAEWQLFSIGVRIGEQAPELARTWEGGYAELSPYLTSRERRQLSASELVRCVQWVGVGMMYAVLCQTVTDLRAF